MKKFLLLFSASLAFAEPSAFSAGDLNSNNPYGLTETEKHILKNKKEISSLQKQLENQEKSLKKLIEQQDEIIKKLSFSLREEKLKVKLLKDRVDGFESMLPSFDEVMTKVLSLSKESESIQQKIIDLYSLNQKNELFVKEEMQKNLLLQNKNIENLSTIIEKIANEIDTIKNDLTQVKKKSTKTTLSNSETLKLGITKVKEKEWNKAIELFDTLIKRRYKPATSNYYLGEVEYYRGNFETALGFYKKSIKIYSETAYFTPQLLYHAGVSFEKTGKKKQAYATFQKLLQTAPSSGFVKYAKERMEKLN